MSGTLNTMRLAAKVENTARPPGWLLNGSAIALACVTAVYTSLPGGAWRLPPQITIVWTLVGALWCLRFFVWATILADQRRTKRQAARFGWRLNVRAANSSNWMRSIAAWSLIPIVVALVLSDIPLRLRFELSRSQLESAAYESMARPEMFPETADLHVATQGLANAIGLFPVLRREAFSGGVRFVIEGAGFWGIGGLLYSSNGFPLRDGERYASLSANWYVWEFVD